MAKRYWLFKSEPDVYSIDHLIAEKSCHWEGVRSYQARNLLRDEIKIEDSVFFYHSNAKPPGIIGICKVIRAGYPDHTAFDAKAKYYDAKSDPDNPRWFMVDVEFVEKFDDIISLHNIKANPALAEMVLVNSSRLSVQPVQLSEWKIILKMGGLKITDRL